MINSVPFYMLASSTMLVMNKVAISVFERPLLLLFIQLSFTSLTVLIGGELKVFSLTGFNKETLKKFWLVPLTFLLSIFSNIKILQHTNVETFIVLRASTPLIMSILDVQFLNRRLPSKRSWGSIVTVFIFATLYVILESKTLTTDSMLWVVIWYANFCFDQIYIKHVVDTVKMTLWDRVLYTNYIPTIILSPALFLFEDPIEIEKSDLLHISTIIFSTCALGLMMSYTSFWTRKQVSATTFTVIGNVCKFLTITINYFIWEHHATSYGIMALSVCVIASSFYQQAEYDKDGKDKKKLANFYAVFVLCFVLMLIKIFN